MSMAPPRSNRNNARTGGQDADRAALDELDSVSATVTRVKQQLTSRIQKYQDETARNEDRIRALEAENRALTETVAELRGQLVELQSENDQLKDGQRTLSQVNVHTIIQERDKLRQELRHSRKSLKDLLNNQSSLNDSTPSSKFRTCSEGPWPLQRVEEPRRGSPSRASRLSPMGLPLTRPFSAASSPLHVAGDAAPTEDPEVDLDAAQRGISPFNVTLYGTEPEDNGSDKEIDTDDDDGLWTWQPYDLPKTHLVEVGPMSLDELAGKLQLENRDVSRLHQVRDALNQQTLRFHIVGSRAFVFEPIFLESPTNTFMVSWSQPDTAKKLQDLFWPEGRMELHYHTFICLAGEAEWYYVGRLLWKHVDLPPHWQTMPEETKDMLCHALKARWRTEVSPEEVAQIVEESAQLSIELTCDDVKKLTDRSFSFARKKLGYVIETE